MQTVINILLVLMMVGFLVLVLKELGNSQKNSEKYTNVPTLLRMAVDMRDTGNVVSLRVMYHAETVEELQGMLNAVPMFRIFRAGVWAGTTMTHVMSPMGVLEAV